MCILKSLKRLATAAVAILSLVALQKFCHSKTDGFTDYKIASDLTFHPEWDVKRADEISPILDQPYYYLGKGAQCYVFASKDGNYVIKFFRLYHLRPPAWTSYLPLPSSYKNEKARRKYEELHKDFSSYKIAYDELKDETGLVYLHLNKTSHLQKQLTLYDKIGVLHRIDLDKTEFLVQKRAEPFYPALEKVLEKNDPVTTKKALFDLVQLLAYRSQKGIFDKDPDINTNFGFLAGRPIQIDIGRFRYDQTRKDPEIYLSDIVKITDHLSQWLEAKDPAYAGYLKEAIDSLAASPI